MAGGHQGPTTQAHLTVAVSLAGKSGPGGQQEAAVPGARQAAQGVGPHRGPCPQTLSLPNVHDLSVEHRPGSRAPEPPHQ